MRWAILAGLVLAATQATGQPACEDVFGVTIEPGTLTLRHDGAEYNCCPDGFGYTVEQTDSQILVTESEIVTNPCDCVCCYDLSATFEDLAPGTFELVVSFQQGGSSQPGEWRQVVEIPGTAAGAATVAAVHDSGCLAAAVEAASWSALKGIYR